MPCLPDHLPICKCLGLGTRDRRQIRNQGNQRNQRNQRAAPTELGEGPDPLAGCRHPGGSWSNPAGSHRGRAVLLLIANVGTELNRPGRSHCLTSLTLVCQGSVCFQNSQHDLFICGGSPGPSGHIFTFRRPL